MKFPNEVPVFIGGMPERIKKLYDELMVKVQRNRAGEWFKPQMFPNIDDLDTSEYGLSGSMTTKTVLVRRAVAIDIMLKAMTNKKNSEQTGTAEILEGDLLLGILPMGSNGLGKVFPKFLSDDALRAGSVTNRNMSSLFGHNTMNYTELLSGGLKKIIDECDNKKKEFENALKENNSQERLEMVQMVDQVAPRARKIYKSKSQMDFYTAVKISCQAVIDYAHRFAQIAEEKAKKYPKDSDRYEELKEMARIAKKVPEYPAESFHEALQSITFFHIGLHSSMNLLSLGRLDQVLQPYLDIDLEKGKDINKALEIFECFVIKLAGRLNMNPYYLKEQDHIDYGANLGTHPYYIDQKVGANNFLQNVIVGGQTPDGKDATNAMTFLILQSVLILNLPSPGFYVRVHRNSPKELLDVIAKTIVKTKNNPVILNDEALIPAMYRSLMQDDLDALNAEEPTEKMLQKREEMQKLANDYCVDGCWEPILNGKGDWTFFMFNAMTALEVGLNGGAKLSPEPELLKGSKLSVATPIPTNFKELLESFKTQLYFFTDQCCLSIFLYYMLDEYTVPSPLMSALLKGCMEKGRDKSWGGAAYNLGGTVYGGIPNVVNTLAAIKKWVFPDNIEEAKYTLDDVTEAFRYNFVCEDATKKSVQNMYDSIRIDFDTNSPKFGNDDEEADEITKIVLDYCCEAVDRSAKFAKKVYQNKPAPEDWKNIIALRCMTGYYGESLESKFGSDFQMKFTVGLGTFGQYNWQGKGLAACADRKRDQPIAPNFTPVPGTTQQGVVGLFNSFSKFDLDRFAAGVITDICLDADEADFDALKEVINKAISSHSPIISVSIGSEDLYREIYEKVIAAGKLSNKEEAIAILAPYVNVLVRLGGFQAPFITLPLSHMENYIHRPVKM